jgi:hypothetical protein
LKTDLSKDYTNEKTGLTEKEEHFLSILFGEHAGDFSSALTASGINESPMSIRRRLKKEIQDATEDYLASATAKAAISLVGVLYDPAAPGAKSLISAAKEIMDRGGVTVKQEPTVTEHNIFILPAKEPDQNPLVIDHEE